MQIPKHWKNALAIIILLAMASCLDRESIAPTTDVVYQQKMITRVMSYIQSHEKQFTYLTEKKLSSKDIKVKYAETHPTTNGMLIRMPVIRYLCDSLATYDSMYFAPKRILILAHIKNHHSKPDFCFMEQDPTREYHKANRTRLWYGRQFTGITTTYTHNNKPMKYYKIRNGEPLDSCLGAPPMNPFDVIIPSDKNTMPNNDNTHQH